MNIQTKTRGQFLKEMGLSSAALMAFYCMGTGLTACTAEEPAPNTNSNTNSNTNNAGNTKIDFTLNLASDDFKKLKTEGEWVYKDTIIVARVKGGAYVALSKDCTHQGVDVTYNLNTNVFKCPLHGSEFNTDGSVKLSPASASLKVYKTELSGDMLKVTE